MEEEKSKRRSLGFSEPTAWEKRWQIVENFVVIPLLICIVYLLIYGGWMVYTEPLEGDIVNQLTGFLAKILIFPVMAIVSCMAIAAGLYVLLEGNRKILKKQKPRFLVLVFVGSIILR